MTVTDIDSRATPSKRSWLAKAFGATLAGAGVILAIGGLWLAGLGGSLYYLLLGLLLITSGYFYYLLRAEGFYVFAATFVLTVFWTFWEVGLTLWPLVPRLVGMFILLVCAILLITYLNVPNRAHLQKLSGIAAGAFAAIMTVLVPLANRLPTPEALPQESATAAFESPKLAAAPGEWPAYGGGQGALRYSSASQITPENVKNLKRAWTFHTGDIPKKYGSELTPIKVGSSIYGCSAMNKVFAVKAATGEKLWLYDPKVPENWVPYTAACRGVSYYKVPNAQAADVCAERIITATLDMRLIAVDAKTGTPCPGFGKNGEADLKVGLAPLIPGTVAMNAPPAIVRGVIVTGHQVLDGQRRWAASGVLRGFDAVSGELRFAWDVNQPEVTKLPPDGMPYSMGTPNSWAAGVGDEELGLVYFGMGNSAADYFSGMRSPEENKVASSIVALDVTTGKQKWVFQTVRMDVWDYDIGAQASLIEYPTADGQVPALLISTKVGEIFILDRRTGQPLHPVKEVQAPGGGAEPDQRAKTQILSGFHTLRKPNLVESDMWGLSPIDQMICRINFRRARYEGIFTPPEVGRANIEYPGYNGGTDWGSVAIDPKRGVIVANYNDMPNYTQLVTREEANKLGLFPAGDPRAEHSASSAEGAGAMDGTPYGVLVNAGWQMPTGVLCTRPPYGGIRAIDLRTGKTLWDRPFGTARRNGPLGIPSYLPIEIGTPNNGGSVVTASGLVFIAAATDDLFRAIDLRTGDTLWSDVLPAGGQANPMVYEENGKQYAVIMAGGHHFMMTEGGDSLIAYALPDGGDK